MVEIKGANLAERRTLQGAEHAELKRSMELYNLDLCPMPQQYIDFHAGIAQEVLEALATRYRLRVIERKLCPSGFFDGMKELNAIVEDSHGRVHKLVYCDSNQGFLLKCQGGGAGFFKPEETFG